MLNLEFENELSISSFSVLNCAVDFAINEDLENKEFTLVYDSEPEWEGDDILPSDFTNELTKTIALAEYI